MARMRSIYIHPTMQTWNPPFAFAKPPRNPSRLQLPVAVRICRSQYCHARACRRLRRWLHMCGLGRDICMNGMGVNSKTWMPV